MVRFWSHDFKPHPMMPFTCYSCGKGEPLHVRRSRKMFRVTLPSRVIGLAWRHRHLPDAPLGAPMSTICQVFECSETGSEVKEIGKGVAHTSPREPRFIKEAGRKLSLKRALENADIGKFDRSQIWMAYHNRLKAPKFPIGDITIDQADGAGL